MRRRPKDTATHEVPIDDVARYITAPLLTWRVSLPAKATSFARDQARVDGVLGVQFFDTTRAYRPEAPVMDLPVIFPGGDGYGLYHDVVADDPLVLLAGDAEQRGFWETGDATAPVTGFAHTYGNAVAFAGGRISNTTVPTPAPNAAGEMLVGARDGTSGVRLRRARPDNAPPEFGTTIVEAAGPTASLLLGSASAAVPAACAPGVDANFALVAQVIQALPVVPGDPGVIAALKVAFGVGYTAALQPTADAKARFDGPLPGP